MKRDKVALLAVAFVAFALVFSSCGGGGDGDGWYACSYEKRVTDGCDGYGWGDWVSECFAFNSEDYYISPEQVCANVTEGGLFCQAGCCVDSEFRNVSLTEGDCP